LRVCVLRRIIDATYMKIAVLAPFEESVPPKKYGGTESVVYNLIVELVALGHDVTMFGTGDSNVPCKVVPIFPHTIRSIEPYASDMQMRDAAKFLGIGKVLAHLENEQFDIIHNNLGWRFLLFAKTFHMPLVTTLHNPISKGQEQMGFLAYPDLQFVSISDNQRKPLPELQYVKTVYNGIDLDMYPFSETHDGYLFFLGRMSQEKGVKEAIDVAKKTNRRLLIAAKVDLVDEPYYEMVKPFIDGKQIMMLGEITGAEKTKLLQQATALVSPIQWEEPFGLVAIEAMSCGTPVLGMARGAYPEIITPGRNGFLATTVDEMITQVGQIASIDRHACRKTVEERFTRRHMAEEYVRVYEKILQTK
jgi:glycosyltransferase involved in cell wall biosynthesis